MTNKTREEFEARIEHHKELISIKEERIVELEAERDKLREQNEMLAANLSDIKVAVVHASYHPGLEKITEFITQEMMDGDGSDCLARIRAEAKAEALEDFRSEFELHCEVPDFILGCLEEYADEYRQQAEEGEE